MLGVTMGLVLEALSSEEDATCGGVSCDVDAVIAGSKDGSTYADFVYSPKPRKEISIAVKKMKNGTF